MKNADTVSCAPCAVPCRDRAMAGSAGRYMSMEIGPKPVSAPKRITRPIGAFAALASPVPVCATLVNALSPAGGACAAPRPKTEAPMAKRVGDARLKHVEKEEQDDDRNGHADAPK
jgi:hypothetical protein